MRAMAGMLAPWLRDGPDVDTAADVWRAVSGRRRPTGCSCAGVGARGQGVPVTTRRVPPLPEVAAAVRAAWSRETCDDADLADWTPANPARGQCGVTALTVQDLLGGDLLLAEVLRADGSRQGVHWWNRLPDASELDLTREQFAPGELVQAPRVVPRPPGPPRRGAAQHARFRAAVGARLR